MTDRSPYAVLGVAPDAPDEVLRAAYKARIRMSHPDAGGSHDEAQAVNAAWALIGTAKARAAYDRERPEPVPREDDADIPTDGEPPAAAATITHEPDFDSWQLILAIVISVPALGLCAACAVAGAGAGSAIPWIPLVASLAAALLLLRHPLIAVAVLLASFMTVSVPTYGEIWAWPAAGYGALILSGAAVVLWARLLRKRRLRRETSQAAILRATASAEDLDIFEVRGVWLSDTGICMVDAVTPDGRTASFEFRERLFNGEFFIMGDSPIRPRLIASRRGMRRDLRRTR